MFMFVLSSKPPFKVFSKKNSRIISINFGKSNVIMLERNNGFNSENVFGIESICLS